jgi:hypothetical protein
MIIDAISRGPLNRHARRREARRGSKANAAKANITSSSAFSLVFFLNPARETTFPNRDRENT